jgi:cobalt/nickel transport system permease protein
MIKKLDPRSKLFSVFLFMALVIATPGGSGRRFLAYFLMASVLIAASGIPLLRAVRRLLLIAPLLGFLALSILLFSSLPQPDKVQLIQELAFKTGLCLSAVLVLVRTTDFTALIQGLEKWKAPKVLTSVLTFAQRYTQLFIQEIETTRRAWMSRSFGRIRKKDSLKMAARLVPRFFLNSLGQSEAVYAAMLSRGYDGSLPARNPLRLQFLDYAFTAVFGLAAVMVQVMVP